MKLRTIGWLALVTLAVACGTTIRSAEVVWFDRSETSAEVRVLERFGVELPANHTTGYEWRLVEPLDEKIVTLVGTDYVADDPSVVGSGGVESWVFRGEGLGVETIRLEYVRPWEENQLPADTYRLTIRVRYGGVNCTASS